MGKLRKFFDRFRAHEGQNDKRAHSRKWLKGCCPVSVFGTRARSDEKERVAEHFHSIWNGI